MKGYRFTRPPSVLYKSKLDNLALVPASLLAFKAQWQAIANRMPQGTVLIVLPKTNGTARRSADMVVRYLRAEGRSVAVMVFERLTTYPIPYPKV